MVNAELRKFVQWVATIPARDRPGLGLATLSGLVTRYEEEVNGKR